MAGKMSAPRGSPASMHLLVAAVFFAVALLAAAPCAAFAPQPSAAGAELRAGSSRPSALPSSSSDADPGLSRRQVGELA